MQNKLPAVHLPARSSQCGSRKPWVLGLLAVTALIGVPVLLRDHFGAVPLPVAGKQRSGAGGQSVAVVTAAARTLP